MKRSFGAGDRRSGEYQRLKLSNTVEIAHTVITHILLNSSYAVALPRSGHRDVCRMGHDDTRLEVIDETRVKMGLLRVAKHNCLKLCMIEDHLDL